MIIVQKSKVVPYSCAQMFDLVNDVAHYCEFLPYCSHSVVHFHNENEARATLTITAAGFSKSFTTHNNLQTNKMIEIRLVDGPFEHLEGFWRFDAEKDGCQISFDLEFEFSGNLLAKIVGPVFEQISHTMVDSFCERAESIYVKS